MTCSTEPCRSSEPTRTTAWANKTTTKLRRLNWDLELVVKKVTTAVDCEICWSITKYTLPIPTNEWSPRAAERAVRRARSTTSQCRSLVGSENGECYANRRAQPPTVKGETPARPFPLSALRLNEYASDIFRPTPRRQPLDVDLMEMATRTVHRGQAFLRQMEESVTSNCTRWTPRWSTRRGTRS